MMEQVTLYAPAIIWRGHKKGLKNNGKSTGIEPQTSHILGNHLTNCAILDLMTSYTLK
jgi:hypothetical protein